ncbi:MAG: hypothetical protein RML93_00420 [Anaerolineales bacterium]|nr:Gmad2 immunoglobulin-like domain-containing protein [Anaerolineales bacterium]MDW8445734.1 hypothetical protein [Anaerolineales bacterium]
MASSVFFIAHVSMGLRRFLCSFGVLLFMLGVGGCGLPRALDLPTPYPSEILPTLIAQTVQAQRTERAALRATASLTLLPTPLGFSPEFSPTPPSPTVTPTLTRTPSPEQLIPVAVTPPVYATISNAVIQINRPGPYSKVASPILLQAYIKPGKGRQVQIELFGEDRRVLVRQIQRVLWVDRFGYARLYQEIPFEIPGVAEAAWLTLSVTDDLGRLTAVNSVPLILLSIGDSDVIPAVDLRAPILIQQPQPNALVQGKKLVVSGLVRSEGDTYLMAQLLNAEGKVLGQRVTSVQPAEELGLGSFNTEVPYTVSEPTPALLVVWQGAGNLSNILYLASVEVLLTP